ncbi:MAG TPA: sigma-70 family RNA polymerase sigma factor [Amycolatopsis sp.]|nr:sigma-70 family RNA polymerase sigma factor [Amycolatopsis sp.]
MKTPEPDSVRQYLDEIGATPLLSADDEVRLAKRIEAGVYAAELLRRGGDLPADRRDLEAVADDGARAKEHMIRANLRLVVAAARKRRDRALPLLDLVQEGNLGLIRAVEKFDYAKGYKFSTYAMWWIRQAMQRGSALGSRTIRLPEHTYDQLAKLERADRALRLVSDRDPTVEELAEAASLPVARVRELRDIGRTTVSLDTPVGDDGDTALGDLLDAAATDPVADTVEQEAERDQLHASLGELPALERTVISLRYGLFDGRPWTIPQTADHVGLRRAQVRKLESEALAHLRESEELALAG